MTWYFCIFQFFYSILEDEKCVFLNFSHCFWCFNNPTNPECVSVGFSDNEIWNKIEATSPTVLKVLRPFEQDGHFFTLIFSMKLPAFVSFWAKNSANVKICEKIIQWLIDRSRLVINLGSHLRSASVQILFNYQWRHLLPFNEKLPIFNVSCSWLTFEANVRDINIECSKQFKWHLYFYVSGQSWPFWAVLKLL